MLYRQNIETYFLPDSDVCRLVAEKAFHKMALSRLIVLKLGLEIRESSMNILEC